MGYLAKVTLRVRVWIETKRNDQLASIYLVTLRVRVWIETSSRRTYLRALYDVTLRVRVWIETVNHIHITIKIKSPSA